MDFTRIRGKAMSIRRNLLLGPKLGLTLYNLADDGNLSSIGTVRDWFVESGVPFEGTVLSKFSIAEDSITTQQILLDAVACSFNKRLFKVRYRVQPNNDISRIWTLYAEQANTLP